MANSNRPLSKAKTPHDTGSTKSISSRTLKMTYIAVSAILIAICSWISIPMPVPFTLQTFAVAIVLLLLGGKLGTAAIGLYLFLGFVGLPVFASFKGGPSALFGMTGGYLIGFLLTGLVYLLIVKFFGNKLIFRVTGLVIGLILCYAFGTIWFIIVYTGGGTAISVSAALGMCVIPFIVPDAVKMALAVIIAGKIKPLLKHLD